MVFKSVREMEETKAGRATPIEDESGIIKIIEGLSTQYQKEIGLIADMINEFSRFIPSRRKRKLHIGLFGYSRQLGKVQLPRAITFCAALYSMGLPPELLGISAVKEKELEIIREINPAFDTDMTDSLRYFNRDNMKYFPKEIRENVMGTAGMFEYEPDAKHQKITGIIMEDYLKKNNNPINENIIRAASIRGFLG